MTKWTITQGGNTVYEATNEECSYNFPKNTGATDIEYTIDVEDDNGCTATETVTVSSGSECQENDREYYCQAYRFMLYERVTWPNYFCIEDKMGRGGTDGIDWYECNGAFYEVEINKNGSAYPRREFAVGLEYNGVSEVQCDEIRYSFYYDEVNGQHLANPEQYLTITEEESEGILYITFNSYDGDIISLNHYITINIDFTFYDSLQGKQITMSTIFEMLVETTSP